MMKKLIAAMSAFILTATQCTSIASASTTADDALLAKYQKHFLVLERKVPADHPLLTDEIRMQDSVYENGILYSAYASDLTQEYDWAKYVVLSIDDSTDPPLLLRTYLDCEQENGFWYSIHEDRAILHGADTELFADTECLAIPETLGGVPVREIAPHALDGLSGAVFPKLREIVIPDSVEVICSYAFHAVFSQEKNAPLSAQMQDCKINLPGAVQYIGHFAFGYGTVCAFGDTVTLPETLEYIDQYAFYDSSVQIDLMNDPQHAFETENGVPGKCPYLLTETGYVPLSEHFYPAIRLPETTYVCNADHIAVQAGFHTTCKHALGRKAYAAYYVQQKLSYPAGDLNQDARVNVADLILMNKYLMNTLGNAQIDRSSGDINGDGRITAADLTFLKRILLSE